MEGKKKEGEGKKKIRTNFFMAEIFEIAYLKSKCLKILNVERIIDNWPRFPSDTRLFAR